MTAGLRLARRQLRPRSEQQLDSLPRRRPRALGVALPRSGMPPRATPPHRPSRRRVPPGLQPRRHADRHGQPRRRVELWDAATGRLVDTLSGHAQDAFGVAFSPDGSHLASTSADGTINALGLDDSDEARSAAPATGARIVWDVAFSPDGRSFATAESGGVRTALGREDPARSSRASGDVGDVYRGGIQPRRQAPRLRGRGSADHALGRGRKEGRADAGQTGDSRGRHPRPRLSTRRRSAARQLRHEWRREALGRRQRPGDRRH